MTRALRSRALGALAAVVAVATLLAVPALHGALDHVHRVCPAEAAGCGVAASDAALASVPGALACPLCLASSQARTLLGGGPGQGLAVGAAGVEAPLRPAAPPLPTPLARSVSAPRAPPSRA